MRIVLLLLVLAAIGVGLSQWLLNRPSHSGAPADRSGTPAVPTRPQDLQPFEQNMNRFMEDAAAEQKRRIERQEQAP